MVHIHDPRTAQQKMHCGYYEVELMRYAAQWKIARTRIQLQNDCVATVLDFYLL